MGFTEISILIRLILGALATFFGILLWSRTQDAAWIFVILGILVSYAEIIFSTLRQFGIIHFESLMIPLFESAPLDQIIQVILINLPLLLYTVAFIILVSRRRIP
jgi:hypothetical protein